MKNPCRELETANRIWKVREASLIVKAARIQVSPKRTMIPNKLMARRMFDFLCALASLAVFPSLFLVCLIRTMMITMKMIILNSRTAKLGPRNAAKNTLTSPMKQLERKMKPRLLPICCTSVYSFLDPPSPPQM